MYVYLLALIKKLSTLTPWGPFTKAHPVPFIVCLLVFGIKLEENLKAQSTEYLVLRFELDGLYTRSCFRKTDQVV